MPLVKGRDFTNAEGMSIRRHADHREPVGGFALRELRSPPAFAARFDRPNPTLAIFAIRTMEEVRTMDFWQYRLFGYMFGISTGQRIGKS